MYNKESTYQKDFDPPVYRRGRRVLENPNKDKFEPYAPWGAHGGGAPRADDAGQRKTRIQGAMGVLGREVMCLSLCLLLKFYIEGLKQNTSYIKSNLFYVNENN